MSLVQTILGAPMTHRRAAFTLVELLVVIGIIALLISILLPALGRAKGAANTVKCLSNPRQLATAARVQATERNGFIQLVGEKERATILDPSKSKFIWYRDGGNNLVPLDWASALLPYLGDKTSIDKIFKDSPGKRDVYKCPSDSFQEDTKPGYRITVNIGLSNTADYVPASYGINADIACGIDPGNGQGYYNYNTVLGVYQGPGRPATIPLGARLNKVNRAAETALFADMGVRPMQDVAQVVGNPTSNKLMRMSDELAFSTDDFDLSPPRIPGAAAITDDVQGTMEYVNRTKRLPFDRHGGKRVGNSWRNGKLNVAFADGHAETMLQDDLKKVRVSPYKW